MMIETDRPFQQRKLYFSLAGRKEDKKNSEHTKLKHKTYFTKITILAKKDTTLLWAS
jgi:hypothetical protein